MLLSACQPCFFICVLLPTCQPYFSSVYDYQHVCSSSTQKRYSRDVCLLSPASSPPLLVIWPGAWRPNPGNLIFISHRRHDEGLRGRPRSYRVAWHPFQKEGKYMNQKHLRLEVKPNRYIPNLIWR